MTNNNKQGHSNNIQDDNNNNNKNNIESTAFRKFYFQGKKLQPSQYLNLY